MKKKSETNKMAPTQTDQAPKEEKPRHAAPRLDIGAIMASSGKCKKEAEAFATAQYSGGNFTHAIVVNLDIRSSTTFMLHVEDFPRFADNLAGFATYVKQSCTSKGGWFDKFTGDGAMFFWVSDSDVLVAKQLLAATQVAVNIQMNFIQHFLPIFRLSAGCVPENFGLGIGMDWGRCMLSDLKPSGTFGVDGVKVGIEPVAMATTLLGRAVVGSARLAKYARAHQILLNEQPGEFLDRVARQERGPLIVRQVKAPNEEFGGNQFAFDVTTTEIQAAIRNWEQPQQGQTQEFGLSVQGKH